MVARKTSPRIDPRAGRPRHYQRTQSEGRRRGRLTIVMPHLLRSPVLPARVVVAARGRAAIPPLRQPSVGMTQEVGFLARARHARGNDNSGRAGAKREQNPHPRVTVLAKHTARTAPLALSRFFRRTLRVRGRGAENPHPRVTVLAKHTARTAPLAFSRFFRRTLRVRGRGAENPYLNPLPCCGDRTRWSKRLTAPAESDRTRDRYRRLHWSGRIRDGAHRPRWLGRFGSPPAVPTRPGAGPPATRRWHRVSDRSRQPIGAGGGTRRDRSSSGPPAPRAGSSCCVCSHHRGRDRIPRPRVSSDSGRIGWFHPRQ